MLHTVFCYHWQLTWHLGVRNKQHCVIFDYLAVNLVLFTCQTSYWWLNWPSRSAIHLWQGWIGMGFAVLKPWKKVYRLVKVLEISQFLIWQRTNIVLRPVKVDCPPFPLYNRESSPVVLICAAKNLRSPVRLNVSW